MRWPQRVRGQRVSVAGLRPHHPLGARLPDAPQGLNAPPRRHAVDRVQHDRDIGIENDAHCRQCGLDSMPPSVQIRGASSDNPLALLTSVEELRSAGIITDAEFASKKAEILSRI